MLEPDPNGGDVVVDVESARETLGVLLKSKDDIDAIRGTVIAELIARV